MPGIQYAAGGWDLRPHRDRVLTIDRDVLASWAELFDEPGTPADQARLLRPVTRADLDALAVLARQPVRLADHEYHWTRGHEEDRAKKDGIIEWRTEVPSGWDEVILQGPHFTVATPFAKQPNENCANNKDYSAWDLETLPERVIPRTNYQRACTPEKYAAAIDQWNGQPSTSYYRVAWRNMTQPGLERSLQSALIPPGPSHVNTVLSLVCADNRRTTLLSAFSQSVVFDYLTKVSGTGHIQIDQFRRFPAPLDTLYAPQIHLRTLRLNCLTADYAPLWEELFDPAWLDDTWAEPAITRSALGDVDPTWTMATPLRTDYDRRKALVELDALAALALGLTADQLCAMYASQFPVLRKYEYNMRFTRASRRIAKDHQQHGFHQQKGDWDIAAADDTLYRPNREAEMRVAMEAFQLWAVTAQDSAANTRFPRPV